jgi:N,N'-diacetylchitobiose non-reducing end deacetylase
VEKEGGTAMNIRQVLGLPELLDVKKAVCIQPHPDDNEVGMAGTVLELANRGCEIVYVTVTDGRSGSFDGKLKGQELIEKRKQEVEAAGQLLGISKQIYLDFPDAGTYSEDAVFLELIRVFRQEKPEIVLTVDPWMLYEAHPDHIKTGLAVARAAMFSGNHVILPESTPYAIPQVGFYHTTYPNTFVDVTVNWQKKVASIFAHDSQFGNPEGQMVSLFLSQQAQEHYRKAYVGNDGYAEAFKVLATQELHSIPTTIYS